MRVTHLCAAPTRRDAVYLFLGLSALVTGCASPPRPQTSATVSWSGRIALHVDEETPRSFAALFDLQGSPSQGELLLQTPMGTSLARISWDPSLAQLQSGKDHRTAATLDELLHTVTGTSFPVPALFDWLEGRATTVPGWNADLSLLPEGRLTAKRHTPAPSATLRILLSR